MSKFWIVLKREYLTRVTKKSFLILTFLTPLIMVGIVLVPMILGMTARDTSHKEIIVVDRTGKYFETIATIEKETDEGFTFKSAPTADLRAYQRLSSEEAPYAVVYISDDLLTHPRAINIYTYNSIPPTLSSALTDVLNQALKDEKIDSYQIPDLKQIMKDSEVHVYPTTLLWDAKGAEKESSSSLAMIIGQLFNFCIFFFVFMYGSMVMQSVTEEKKNRIVEIIASSVRPTQLLFAKIIAIGCLGLTQIVMWIVLLTVFFLIGQLLLFNTATLSLTQLQDTVVATGEIPVEDIQSIFVPLQNFDFSGLIIAFIFFFIVSYVSYSALFAAAGAAMDSDEDVQQLIMPITLIMMFGFYSAIYSASNPNGPLALWGSFIPFIAPNVMLVRLPFAPPTWQIVLSVVLTTLFSVLFVWIAAKIFKVGLLMYGKKPSIKELGRWLTYK